MTKGEFETYLQSPQLLDEKAIPGLQSMVDDFPYFQSAHLLLTKAYQKTESLKFDGQLKKTAAFAISRKKLHDLLFENQLNPEAPAIDAEKSLPTEPEGINTSKSNIDEYSSSDSTEKEEKSTEETEQLLENQILSEAINNSILLEVEDEIPEIDSLTPSESKETKKEDVSEDSFPKASRSNKAFNENEAHSFSEWLHFYSDREENIEVDEEKEETESDYSSHSSRQLPVKNEFYSASKMARLSVQEDDDLVTETLATIYADQGNPEKAIKAFKKLQLKYPEKRVYFANRIKEIQNQLNS